MRVGMYAPQLHPGCRALASGCGGVVRWEKARQWNGPRDFDVVVVHGLRGIQGSIAWAYRQVGVPVLVTDLPRLRHRASEIGVFLNTLHALPACGVPGRRTVLPAVRPVRTSGQRVLVLGQRPGDASHGLTGEQLGEWLADQVRDADLPVVYRHHPKGERSDFPLPCAVEEPDRPIDFADVARVVTYCSTAGLEAILAGVPVTCHPSAYYAPWADLTRDRHDLLARVDATQWSVDELASGAAWAFLTEWAGIRPMARAA